MGFSVDFGLANDGLTLAQVRQVCGAIPIDAVRLRVGEAALNFELGTIAGYLREQGTPLSIASNGRALAALPDETLQAFDEVQVAIDFPNEKEQDAFRGPGCWTLAQASIDRCFCRGVEVSISTVLMGSNYDRAADMVDLARRSGVNLRVKVYAGSAGDGLLPSYEQFWFGYRQLMLHGRLIACSEPVLRAAMGLEAEPTPCGRSSLYVNARGQVLPCAHWPAEGREVLTISDLLALGEAVSRHDCFRPAVDEPTSIDGCLCRGGCAGRRALSDRMDGHDPYCPLARGDDLRLEWTPAHATGRVFPAVACSTIVA